MTAKAAFRAVAGPDAAELDCDRLLRVLQLMHPHFSRHALVELCTDLHAVLGHDKKMVRLYMHSSAHSRIYVHVYHRLAHVWAACCGHSVKSGDPPCIAHKLYHAVTALLCVDACMQVTMAELEEAYHRMSDTIDKRIWPIAASTALIGAACHFQRVSVCVSPAPPLPSLFLPKRLGPSIFSLTLASINVWSVQPPCPCSRLW